MIEKKRGRKSKRPPQAELETLYSRMTAKEVGQHYGVAEQTVYTWLNFYKKEELERINRALKISEKTNKGGGKIENARQAV